MSGGTIISHSPAWRAWQDGLPDGHPLKEKPLGRAPELPARKPAPPAADSRTPPGE